MLRWFGRAVRSRIVRWVLAAAGAAVIVTAAVAYRSVAEHGADLQDQLARMGSIFENRLVKAGIPPDEASARALRFTSIISLRLQQPLPSEKMAAVEQSLSKRSVLPFDDLSELESELAGEICGRWVEELAAREPLTTEEQQRLNEQYNAYIDTARDSMQKAYLPEEQESIRPSLAYMDQLLKLSWDDPLRPLGKRPLPQAEFDKLTGWLRTTIARDVEHYRGLTQLQKGGGGVATLGDGIINSFSNRLWRAYFTPVDLGKEKMKTIASERFEKLQVWEARDRQVAPEVNGR